MRYILYSHAASASTPVDADPTFGRMGVDGYGPIYRKDLSIARTYLSQDIDVSIAWTYLSLGRIYRLE